MNEAPKLKDVAKVEAEGSREVPIVSRAALQLREAVTNRWFLHAPAGLRLADVTRPEAWGVVAALLHPFDVIDVHLVEEELWVQLLVRACVPGKAVLVRVGEPVVLGVMPTLEGDALPAGHRIFQDPAHGWCVERTKDGVVTMMARGSDHAMWSRRDARAWLENHASLRPR